MFNKEINQKFLTIEKKEFSFGSQKLINKVFKLYQKNIFPPTIFYTSPQWIFETPEIPKTLNFKQKEISKELFEKFKENIEIQKEVLNVIKTRNEKYKYRCWLIKLTTWKWKSHIIMDLVWYYQTNSLILVHNVKTLNEMYQKFKEFTNIVPAKYWWWKKDIWEITIMTKKSFTMDFEKFENNFNLIICDEAPIWFSKNFYESMNIFCHKKTIAFYWLSWTPENITFNETDLQKYFWKLINPISDNYNIIPDFEFVDFTTNNFYEFENASEMRECLSMDQERLDEQIKFIKNQASKSNCLLVLTDRVSETENFSQKLNDSKEFFVFTMTWLTKDKTDQENIENAKKSWKKIIIIWTIKKVWVWVDITMIDSVFLASAIKFRSTVIQAVWRALRKFEWKEKVKVIIWNDVPIYQKQKTEKVKTIKQEYWIEKNEIKIHTIKIENNHLKPIF